MLDFGDTTWRVQTASGLAAVTSTCRTEFWEAYEKLVLVRLGGNGRVFQVRTKD